MKEKTNLIRRSIVCAMVVGIFIFGASVSTSAQDAKYPKPDFSALEEYYEIVKYEFDFNANIPALNLVIKRKSKNSPIWWKIKWVDAEGIKVRSDSPSSGFAFLPEVGEPFRVSFYAPWKKEMPRVKKIEVYETPT